MYLINEFREKTLPPLVHKWRIFSDHGLIVRRDQKEVLKEKKTKWCHKVPNSYLQIENFVEIMQNEQNGWESRDVTRGQNTREGRDITRFVISREVEPLSRDLPHTSHEL